jgi:hypothetical protein
MQSQPLSFESPDDSRAVRIRDERRRAVQRERVSKTAQFLLGKASLPCATADADLIVIIVKPDDNGRNERICDALQSAPKAKVIVFPPYFSSLAALKELKGSIKQDDVDKLFLWLPYRYCPGLILAQKEAAKEEEDAIAAITLTVLAGPYPRTALVHEFISPYLDLLPVLGGPISQLRVIESAPMGLPVFSFQAVHTPSTLESSTISSGLFTAAGGSFQNIEHANLSIFSTGLWSLKLSGPFLNEVLKRSPISHEVRGTVSHDADPNVLNGSYGLLDRILGGENWGDEAKKKPIIPNVLHLQELIDEFIRKEKPQANSVRF